MRSTECSLSIIIKRNGEYCSCRLKCSKEKERTGKCEKMRKCIVFWKEIGVRKSMFEEKEGPGKLHDCISHTSM